MFFPHVGVPAQKSVYWKYTNPGRFIWSKPPNSSMIYFVTSGAGGGGKASSGTNGGGGGGPGAFCRLIFPAIFVPDVMGFDIGAGGGSGTAGGTTLFKGPSDITLATIGSGGSGVPATSGGTAGAVAGALWLDAGHVLTSSGLAGGTGGTVGVAGTATFSGPPSGGGGGAGQGADLLGGAVRGQYGFPDLPGGRGASSGAIGLNGHEFGSPLFIQYGGSGGGGAAGQGGNGGDGGPGCGGGGGGALSGAGGRGGDGYVYIWSF